MVKYRYDHEGNPFPTVKAMLSHYGITRSQYDNRLSLGWDLEKILTTPPKTTAAYDHEGTGYPTEKAMCRAYRISTDCLHKRLAKGMSLEKALTTPVDRQPRNRVEKTDHTGRTFPSQRDMCKAWGVTPATYRSRRKAGMSIEQALAPGYGATGPDGTRYPSREALYAACGVTAGSVAYYARRDGLDFNAAVKAAVSRKQKAYSYGGKTYPTAVDLCRTTGISPGTFLRRLKEGWDVAAALETPPRTAADVSDPFENRYPSITAMCAAWGCSDTVYRQQKARSGDQNAALAAIAARRWPGRTMGAWIIKACVAFPWFECTRTSDPGPVPVLVHAKTLLDGASGKNDPEHGPESAQIGD